MDNLLEYMLTTADNPFSPFTQFDDWYDFDMEKGYNTLGCIARLVVTSDEISESDQIIAYNEAIDSILELNILGNYVKVTKENFESLIKDRSKTLSVII